ncbi:MAG: glycosyltransferase, partial [Burkholderiales bacterium]
MTPEDSRPLIAHIVHRFAVGGLENGLVNLINGLPRAQWRHLIVALTEVSPDFAKRIDRGDVEFISLNKPPGHLFGQYPTLYRIFRSKRPLIVHTRNMAALEATVPAWAARVPVRIHGEHGWDVGDLGGQSRKHIWIRRLYAPFVSHWIAMSRDIERYLTGRAAIAPRRVTQIYNGVDVQRFERRGADRLAIPDSPFTDPHLWLVGTVGRMQTVKDQTTLVRAFITAVQRSPSAAERMRLVLVGGGPLLDTARGLLEKAQLAPLAWLAGER